MAFGSINARFTVRNSRHPLVKRSLATFKDKGNFRVKPDGSPELDPKLLHPRGVCMRGVWEMENDFGYEGLFEVGTKVPTIVRFSSGTADSTTDEAKKGGRIFGASMKLFTHPSASVPSESRNI